MIETGRNEAKSRKLVAPNELDDLAAILGFQFVQRWDLYAQQLDDGRYVCIRERLRHEHLIAHLNGELTLGMYLLNEESLCRHLIFDADDAPGWRRLKALARVLSELEIPCYLENSRRGGHLWLFMEGQLPGESIREFGRGLMMYFRLGSLELFPKQDKLSGGPGSLIRIPFGIHRKAGHRYGFLGAETDPLASSLREQLRLLEMPRTVTPDIVRHFSAFSPKTRRRESLPREATKVPGVNGDTIPLHEKLKATISVRDFVSQFVGLSPSGSGLCPFHDDHLDSFSVDEARNFWYCFACEKGGSLIDFWMNYQECDFKTATNQLANMLL